jgi:hypothetical protein
VVKSGVEYQRTSDLTVLFNPYKSTDPTYISAKQQEEYLESETILIWQVVQSIVYPQYYLY